MHGRVCWPCLRQSGMALCVFAGSGGSLHFDAVRSSNGLTSAKTCTSIKNGIYDCLWAPQAHSRAQQAHTSASLSRSTHAPPFRAPCAVGKGFERMLVCAASSHFSLPFPLKPCATVSSPLRRWQGLRAHACWAYAQACANVAVRKRFG